MKSNSKIRAAKEGEHIRTAFPIAHTHRDDTHRVVDIRPRHKNHHGPWICYEGNAFESSLKQVVNRPGQYRTHFVQQRLAIKKLYLGLDIRHTMGKDKDSQ